MLLDLPPLCTELIIQFLKNPGDGRDRREDIANGTENVTNAATMALVSKDSFSTYAKPLYDQIDPGCVEALDKLRGDFRNLQKELLSETGYFGKRSAGQGIDEEKDVDIGKMSLVDLRTHCKAIGCSSSGTKAKLIENIQKYEKECEEKKKMRISAIRIVIDKVGAYDLSEFRCPVRPRVRLLHKTRKTLAEGSKLTCFTITEARDMGLRDRDLETLDYIEKRNPFYRGAPPMKLFGKVEIIERLIQVYGPNHARDDKRNIIDLVDAVNNEIAKMQLEVAREQRDEKRIGYLKKLFIAHGIDIEGVGPSTRVNDILKTDKYCRELKDQYLKGKVTKDSLDVRVRELKALLERKRILCGKLAKLGCVLRDDSKLCEAYIMAGRGCPKEIAETMREMKFYYDRTDYANILDEKYERRIRRRRYARYGYGYQYDDYSDDDYSDDDDNDEYDDAIAISERAKLQALTKWIKSNVIDESCTENDDTIPSTIKKQIIDHMNLKKRCNRAADNKNHIVGSEDKRLICTLCENSTRLFCDNGLKCHTRDVHGIEL